MSKRREHKIPILSFFSGGGFMDMGFELAGFDIQWTNEYDEIFSKFHSQGLTSWRKSLGIDKKSEISNKKSIVDINLNEIFTQAFPNGRPNHFGIIGGPPCQDFSLNGSRKGFEGERGKMTIEFISKIKNLSPSFFVIENVPGLIRIKSNKDFYFSLLKILEEDYFIDYKILNSLHFGVPQSRERLFTVGFKKDTFKQISNDLNFSFQWPSNEKYIGIQKNINWPRYNTFGEVIYKPNDVPIHLCVEFCLVKDKELDNIPNANEYFQLKISQDKLNSIKEGETSRPSFKRLHRYRYSPTTCYGNNEVHLHPYLNRRISVREALRIQGVDDNYVLESEVLLSKKFKMIGNGVPVPLAEAVGISIMEFFKINLNNG